MRPLRLAEYSLLEVYKLPGRVAKIKAVGSTVFAIAQGENKLAVYSISEGSSALLYEAEGAYKVLGACGRGVALIYTSREGDRVALLSPSGLIAERGFGSRIGPVAFSDECIFLISRRGLLRSSLVAMDCTGEVLAERQLAALPQDMASSGPLVLLSTASGHLAYRLEGSQLEQVYSDSEPVSNEVRLFLKGTEYISVRRGEVKSLNRGWRREVPLRNPHVVPLGDAILLWEPRSTTLVCLSIADGRVLWTSDLDPVSNVLTDGERALVLLRRRLVALDRRGEVQDIVYLPLPELEEAELRGGDLVFSLVDWVGVARRSEIAPEVKQVRLRRVGGRPYLEAKILVATPSGREALEGVTVLVTRGQETAVASPSEGGYATVMIPMNPGENRVQVTLRHSLQLHGRGYVLESMVDCSFNAPESLKELPNLAGRTLGRRYAVREQLGEGGFAVTYRGRDILTDREVVVKVFDPMYGDPAALAVEAYHAAKAAEKVNRGEKVVVEALDAGRYPVVVTATGESEGEVSALVQEYIDGGSLRGFIDSRPPLERRLQVAAKIAHKLAVLHANGIVHGDIKPENILLYSSGEPVFADLQTAVILSKFETARRFFEYAYTPTYAPPEVKRGVFSREGDVYSLAVTLIETITGVTPRPPNIPVALLRQNLPEEAVRVLQAALSENPGRRPDASTLERAMLKAARLEGR